MRIVINAILFRQDTVSDEKSFIRNVFYRLAEENPLSEFIFIFDKPYDKFIDLPNVTSIVLTYNSGSAFALKYWYNFKLTRAVRSLKADVLVQPFDMCSLSTKVPQVLFLNELDFIHRPQSLLKQYLRFRRKYTYKFVQKAGKIITTCHAVKEDALSRYTIDEKNVSVAYAWAEASFEPIIDWQERQEVKNVYTEGKEYFWFSCTSNTEMNLMSLLKAFSGFKKWQKSNMKLLITGNISNLDIIEKLKTYKYREDVVLLGNVKHEELVKIVAAAYTAVYMPASESYAISVMQAMQSEVTVLAGRNSCLEEIGGDACLLVEPNEHETFAQRMILLYKDEDLRKILIMKGKERSHLFTEKATLDIIQSAVFNPVQA